MLISCSILYHFFMGDNILGVRHDQYILVPRFPDYITSLELLIILDASKSHKVKKKKRKATLAHDIFNVAQWSG